MTTGPLSFRQRSVHAMRMLSLYAHQRLNLPRSWLAPWKREILRVWTPDMLWLYARSLGQRVYMDQQCPLRRPSSYEPQAVVDEPYRLSEQQIRSFYENGFIGPLTAVSPEQMDEYRVALETELEQPSRAFGFHTVRDRHLDSPSFLELFTQPAIIERVAQLLGEDLLLWRSQVFDQQPGAPPVAWHQATTYMAEDYRRPLLEPVDTGELFQLTIWIAVDRATVENGCMQFLPGTHWDTCKVRLGGDKGFYKAPFTMELDIDPAKVVSMELQPGQFVIFSERVVHGSPGNRSNTRRMGVNFRVVRPSTRVYRDQTSHYASHFQQTWDLSNWGVVLVRGQDRERVNKYPPGDDTPE